MKTSLMRNILQLFFISLFLTWCQETHFPSYSFDRGDLLAVYFFMKVFSYLENASVVNEKGE